MTGGGVCVVCERDVRPVGRRRGVTDTDKPSLLSKAALDARKLAEEARASRPRRRAA
jgi:hypothetical protein